jgi:hypothetical protein
MSVKRIIEVLKNAVFNNLYQYEHNSEWVDHPYGAGQVQISDFFPAKTSTRLQKPEYS